MKLINKVFLILWQRGVWKTSLATCIATDGYSKVLANYTIEWLTNFEKYEDYDIFKKLTFQKNKWLVIFDEWGLNLNSRESMSEKNRLLWKLIFVSRKLNYDFIFITQYDFTIDKYIRFSADYYFWVFRKSDWVSEIQVYTNNPMNNKIKLINIYTFEYLKFLKFKGVKYNTLEISKLK
jgi:hypothetical protein